MALLQQRMNKPRPSRSPAEPPADEQPRADIAASA
jgi:hypothetical protein